MQSSRGVVPAAAPGPVQSQSRSVPYAATGSERPIRGAVRMLISHARGIRRLAAASAVAFAMQRR